MGSLPQLLETGKGVGRENELSILIDGSSLTNLMDLEFTFSARLIKGKGRGI